MSAASAVAAVLVRAVLRGRRRWRQPALQRGRDLGQQRRQLRALGRAQAVEQVVVAGRLPSLIPGGLGAGIREAHDQAAPVILAGPALDVSRRLQAVERLAQGLGTYAEYLRHFALTDLGLYAQQLEHAPLTAVRRPGAAAPLVQAVHQQTVEAEILLQQRGVEFLHCAPSFKQIIRYLALLIIKVPYNFVKPFLQVPYYFSRLSAAASAARRTAAASAPSSAPRRRLW